MLDVIQLSCIRDNRSLFHRLSFSVAAGDIVQIEGENGAGKTSLLRLLAGLSQAESGDIRWQNRPVKEQREEWQRNLLFLGHQPGIKLRLSALENLRFYHPDCTPAQIFAALEQVELTGYEELAVAQLSAGQQRRVALARLWLSAARIWILDEPLTAIDRSGVTTLMQQFMRHAARGGAVILTTHQPLPVTDWPLRKITLCPAALTC